MNNYKLVIVTTEGCQACSMVIENVKEAMINTTKVVTVEVKDKDEVGRKYLKYHNITDFPTLLFFVNERVKYKVSGNKHKNMILRWVDLHFV